MSDPTTASTDQSEQQQRSADEEYERFYPTSPSLPPLSAEDEAACQSYFPTSNQETSE